MSPELGRFLALRRVRRGGVAQFAPGVFIDRGRPVPDYIGSYLAVLLAEGDVQLAGAQQGTGYLPLRVTSAGEANYADLADAYFRQLRANRQAACQETGGIPPVSSPDLRPPSPS